MKHSMKKIISLVLVLAMSLAVSVPGFAATKEKESQVTMQSVPLTGVTKYVSTANGFDLYLNNADTIRTINAGTLSSPILGLVPNKIAQLVASISLAAYIADLQYQNSGSGVVIHFFVVYSTPPIVGIYSIEPQAIPMK
ncbi:hypothetical protein [Clostridium sp. KNHs216]|uniref:hypothetical protein n=1 Tax=Clostridium sp. KNHs216 TaxID=1550235 RepID=UPI00114E13B9|nr:hypothetical protein [Clostridium sp. KNHs216]